MKVHSDDADDGEIETDDEGLLVPERVDGAGWLKVLQ